MCGALCAFVVIAPTLRRSHHHHPSLLPASLPSTDKYTNTATTTSPRFHRRRSHLSCIVDDTASSSASGADAFPNISVNASLPSPSGPLSATPGPTDPAITMPPSPLRDARVIFTAPPIYAPRLAAALLAREARPIHMPMIETTALDDTTTLDGAVLTLCDYDLVVFPSRSSIYHFAQSLLTAIPSSSSSSSSSSFGNVPTIDNRAVIINNNTSTTTTTTGSDQSGNKNSAETNIDNTITTSISASVPSSPPSKTHTIDPVLLLRASGVRTAALGADARYVREQLGVTVDYIPPFATPAGLCAFLAADPDLRGKQVLVPIPVVQGMREPPVIPQLLHDLEHNVGCIVTPVPAYCTKPVAADRVKVELDLLLREGAVDAVVVSSTAEANALRAVLANADDMDSDRADDRKRPLQAFVERVRQRSLLIAAHGPVTAGGVAQAFDGFRCVADDEDGTGEGVNVVADDEDDIDAIIVSKNYATFDGVADALEQEMVTLFVKKHGKILMS